MSEFAYTNLSEWPKLSWLACCRSGSSVVEVYHGGGVETRPNWFCEAVWDGPFEDGDFDRTGVVFGSGARRRDDTIAFVSSAATVDRLHVCLDGERTLISNSFPCIVNATGQQVQADAVSNYIDFFLSIQNGFRNYRTELPLSNGHVQLVYFRNLRWDGLRLVSVLKEELNAALDCYSDYKNFLTDRLILIGDNLSSQQREQPFSWLGTLSSGFDSPTCAALAKRAGLKSALTFQESRPGVADDGLAIGEALGIETTLYDRLGWHGSTLWEPLFISADGQGKEISLAAASMHTEGSVLVTGHGGDYIWSTNPKTPLNDLYRGSYSGLSMSEYRLHNNFIHLPIPFIAMSRAGEIATISRSDEMKEWRTDARYDRPICARLLEEAGVPREMFGKAKTGIAVRFVVGEDAWSKTGLRAFRAWRTENRTRLGIPTTKLVMLHVLDFLRAALHKLRPMIRTKPVRKAATFSRERLRFWGRKLFFENHIFVWAVETVGRKYPPPPTE